MKVAFNCPFICQIYFCFYHPQTVELATALVDLFHLIPLAAEKYVSLLIGLTVRIENLCYIEATSPIRIPLVRFLLRHPEETIKQFLTSPEFSTDAHAHRLLLVSPTSVYPIICLALAFHSAVCPVILKILSARAYKLT